MQHIKSHKNATTCNLQQIDLKLIKAQTLLAVNLIFN